MTGSAKAVSPTRAIRTILSFLMMIGPLQTARQWHDRSVFGSSTTSHHPSTRILKGKTIQTTGVMDDRYSTPFPRKPGKVLRQNSPSEFKDLLSVANTRCS